MIGINVIHLFGRFIIRIMIKCFFFCFRDILAYMDEMNGNQTASQRYETIHRLCRHN
jgi:hypothetical protein